MNTSSPEALLKKFGASPENVEPNDMDRARFLHALARDHEKIPWSPILLWFGLTTPCAFFQIHTLIFAENPLWQVHLGIAAWWIGTTIPIATLIMKNGNQAAQSARNYMNWVMKLAIDNKSFR